MLCDRLKVASRRQLAVESDEGKTSSRRHLAVAALTAELHTNKGCHELSASLYPDEALLWRSGLISTDGSPLAGLPKLNLQFLSLDDYLRRCFLLHRLDAADDVRLRCPH